MKYLQHGERFDISLLHIHPFNVSFSAGNSVNIENNDSTNDAQFKVIPFELTNCRVGDDVLFLGHPKSITDDDVSTLTRNGIVNGSDSRLQEFLFKNVLTVTRGKIESTLCDESNRYELHLSCIICNQMSGGPIVLPNDLSKVCRTITLPKVIFVQIIESLLVL